MGPESELTVREGEGQRRATVAAIARCVVTRDAAVRGNTPISRLSDVEWGWIIAAVIFAWISVRAEQATAQGLDVECAIREGAVDAWDSLPRSCRSSRTPPAST
jgi:hypothetical protein